MFINGEVFNSRGLDDDLVIDFCNKRQLKLDNKNRDLAEQLMSLCLIEKST